MKLTATEQKPFKVGDRVRFKGSFSCPPRTGRIAEIGKTHSGHKCYILADGGMFSENELSRI